MVRSALSAHYCPAVYYLIEWEGEGSWSVVSGKLVSEGIVEVGGRQYQLKLAKTPSLVKSSAQVSVPQHNSTHSQSNITGSKTQMELKLDENSGDSEDTVHAAGCTASNKNYVNYFFCLLT